MLIVVYKSQPGIQRVVLLVYDIVFTGYWLGSRMVTVIQGFLNKKGTGKLDCVESWLEMGCIKNMHVVMINLTIASLRAKWGYYILGTLFTQGKTHKV